MNVAVPLFGLGLVGAFFAMALSGSPRSSSSGVLELGAGVKVTQEQVDFLYRLRAATPPDVPIHVTSGLRTIEQQAAAMLKKYELGGAAEIKSIYGSNGVRILLYPPTVEAWAGAIRVMVAEGKWVQKHTLGKAVDIRIRGLTSSQLQALVDAARRVGGRPLVERLPPHLHSSFAGDDAVLALEWA